MLSPHLIRRQHHRWTMLKTTTCLLSTQRTRLLGPIGCSTARLRPRVQGCPVPVRLVWRAYSSDPGKQTIYHSHLPVPELPKCSLFQYHFPDKPSDSPLPMRDPNLPAFIDGYTGIAITRGQFKEQSLRLVTGLRSIGLKRGDVGCIYGLNSFGWLAAWFGQVAAGIVTTPANWAS